MFELPKKNLRFCLPPCQPTVEVDRGFPKRNLPSSKNLRSSASLSVAFLAKRFLNRNLQKKEKTHKAPVQAPLPSLATKRTPALPTSPPARQPASAASGSAWSSTCLASEKALDRHFLSREPCRSSKAPKGCGSNQRTPCPAEQVVFDCILEDLPLFEAFGRRTPVFGFPNRFPKLEGILRENPPSYASLNSYLVVWNPCIC